MYTIDVIGSCICRDIFNSSFINNYSEYFRLKTYIPRMSIPNIIAKSEKFTLNEIKEKSDSPWQFECFFKMCEKNCFDAIENNQSDLLFIDFYSDAKYGIYLTEDNNYITANGLLVKKMYESKNLLLMNYCNNSDFYFELWKKSFDYYIKIIKEIIPNTKIIINGIKGTNKVKNSDNSIHDNNISDEDCQSINEMWSKMNDYAVKCYNLDILTFSEEYYLNTQYIYGGANNEIVHFEMKYYKDAFNKLLNYADENVNKDKTLKTSCLNMVKNNDFRYGLKFWDLRNGFFTTFEQFGRRWIKPIKEFTDVKANYIWIWSNPIEINSDGTEEYTLSFDFVINDKESALTTSLFGIRTFDKSILETFKEKLESYVIPNNHEIYSETGIIYHINFVFKPNGKYIRISPHVDNSCFNIYFSNICLVKGKNNIYIPWKDKEFDTL